MEETEVIMKHKESRRILLDNGFDLIIRYDASLGWCFSIVPDQDSLLYINGVIVYTAKSIEEISAWISGYFQRKLEEQTTQGEEAEDNDYRKGVR